MPGERLKGTKTEDGKRRFGRRKLISAAVIVVTIICVLAWKGGWLDFRSVDEQLAAIDTELAIPDSENAAVYYRRFFTDPKNSAILYDLAAHTPSAYREPWADIEYPELAAKLEKNRPFIQTLLDISQMQKARFPVDIAPGPDSWQMAKDMRKVVFVLSWAGANDLAEGRTDAAHSKYRCQMQLARHFSQQPGIYHKSVGTAFEAVVYGNIKTTAMHDGTTPEQLRSLESILDIPMERGDEFDKITARVNRLIHEKERSTMSTVERLKQLWFGRKTRKQQEQVRHRIRLRLEATRRAIPILLALRRHKERIGSWPETLEQIEPKLPEQMLTDPQNKGPFAYKLSGDGFVFYSKGPNGIDESGVASRPADDYPIWPRRINKAPAGKQ